MELVSHLEDIRSVHQTELGVVFKHGGKYRFYGESDLRIQLSGDKNITRSVLTNWGELILVNQLVPRGFELFGIDGSLRYKSREGVLVSINKEYFIELHPQGNSTKLVSLDTYEVMHMWNVCLNLKMSIGNVCLGAEYFNKLDLVCVNINSGNIEWNYHAHRPYEGLPKEVEINYVNYIIAKIVGELNGIVYSVLQYGLVIGLDITTGTLTSTHLYPEVYPTSFELEPSGRNRYNLSLQPDRENGRLFGLRSTLFYTIELSDLQMKYIMMDIESLQLNNDLAPADGANQFNWPIVDDKVFYWHSSRSTAKNNVGVFDKSAKQIIDAASVGVSLDEYYKPYAYLHPVIKYICYENGLLFLETRGNLDGELYVLAAK